MLLKTACAALGMAMISAQLQAAPSNADEKKTILALRAEHNRAIAAHDLEGTMRIAAEDYVLIGGSSGIERSQAETRKRWVEHSMTSRVTATAHVGNGPRADICIGRWQRRPTPRLRSDKRARPLADRSGTGFCREKAWLSFADIVYFLAARR